MVDFVTDLFLADWLHARINARHAVAHCLWLIVYASQCRERNKEQLGSDPLTLHSVPTFPDKEITMEQERRGRRSFGPDNQSSAHLPSFPAMACPKYVGKRLGTFAHNSATLVDRDFNLFVFLFFSSPVKKLTSDREVLRISTA